ncbi:hypothetical protein [Blastococcus sp. URHD0036]|uniref:hypothetical protein n=1 Tax=Blastococcus sp. URHD0036 TaxID=1380356 RepID=UPI00068FFE3A|nr:hypothetical protein [Blastococcus sp. URHD0036]
MATTLQGLIDGLATQITDQQADVRVDDATRALSHLGRALTRLAEDGFTATAKQRQLTTVALGEACVHAGELWPDARGPVTDRAGAIADHLGRSRELMGRAQRWALAVELSKLAGSCAQLGEQLLPLVGIAPLAAVRQLAAAVGRHAVAEPPAFAGAALLDRLIPMPAAARATADTTAPDAVASLTAALDRAQRNGDFTLRGFRAVTATAEIASAFAATLTSAVRGHDIVAAPAAVAWRATGRASMAFHDGHQGKAPEAGGVVAWSKALADVLRRSTEVLAQTPGSAGGADRSVLITSTQFVTNQLPLLAEQLGAAVGDWARTGHLYAKARELPRMDDMPVDRIRDVIAGRHVRAHADDLRPLADAVARAGVLSIALADSLNQAAPPVQRSLAASHTQSLHEHAALQRSSALATGTSAGPTRLSPIRPGNDASRPHDR